jgi:hypothetical protein
VRGFWLDLSDLKQGSVEGSYKYGNEPSDSVVGIASGYRLDGRGVGVRVQVGARIFPSPCRPDRHWDPPSFLSNGYWGVFPLG